jgi:hypothetical protein
MPVSISDLATSSLCLASAMREALCSFTYRLYPKAARKMRARAEGS